MKFLATLLPLLFAPLLSAQEISFITPEDSDDVSGIKDFSRNPVFTIGERRRIKWTETNESISIVLYQERPEDDFEYVFQNSKGISEYVWNVGTGKDLKNGRVFFFQIFITGETSPTTNSRYFNISDPNEVTTTSSSTSSTISLTSSSTAPPTVSTTSTGPAGTPTGSGTTNPPGDGGSSGGMSTGAKVGLGVGIPVGVIALALLAFFLIRRRKRANTPAELSSSSDYTNNVPPAAQAQRHEKYSEPSAGEYVPNAAQEQAGGYYKPMSSPNAAPSELYSPPQQPQELPSQRYA